MEEKSITNSNTSVKRISVVIPNYNYARFLTERIMSVIQQDYPIYEIIILDDASSDNSMDIVNRFTNIYSHLNFKVIVNEKNTGSTFLQWYKGVNVASGEYVWIAESDDYSKPEFLSQVIKTFNNKSIVLSYCQSILIDEEGNELDNDYSDYVSDISITKWTSAYIENGVNEIKHCLAIKNTIPNVSAVIFRRDILFDCLNKHFEEIRRYKMTGDWLIYVYVLSMGELSFIPDALNYHRRHAESVIFKNLGIDIVKEICAVQTKIRNMYSLGQETILKAEAYSQYLYEQLGLTSNRFPTSPGKIAVDFDNINIDCSKRQILHITTGLGLGGAESLLYECALNCISRGYQPTVVSLKSGGEYVRRFMDSNINVIELDATPNSANIRALYLLCKIINTLKPKVIQSWMYHANLFSSISTLLSIYSSRNNLVWGIFTSETDMASYGKSTNFVAMLGARLSKYPACIIYNAKRAAEDHAKLGYFPRNELIINNGIDVEKYKPDHVLRKNTRHQLGISESECVAIISARNHPQKDWANALLGVSRVKGLITIAVGEGTESLPAQTGLIRLGSRHDMPALYTASDIFILPSAFGEGTSVAMCEAMSSGLPVIVTDVGDNANLGKEAGYVVRIGHYDEIEKSVIELVKDSDLRNKLGKKARDIIINHFSSKESFGKLIDYYDCLA